MGNMSYCRFHNTLEDLQDCYEHMDEMSRREDKDSGEYKAFLKLISLAQNIADEYGECDE